MGGGPIYRKFLWQRSGRGGIRTPGTFNRSFDFESSALNRTQPPFLLIIKNGRYYVRVFACGKEFN